jgi:hypothetical protein
MTRVSKEGRGGGGEGEKNPDTGDTVVELNNIQPGELSDGNRERIEGTIAGSLADHGNVLRESIFELSSLADRYINLFNDYEDAVEVDKPEVLKRLNKQRVLISTELARRNALCDGLETRIVDNDSEPDDIPGFRRGGAEKEYFLNHEFGSLKSGGVEDEHSELLTILDNAIDKYDSEKTVEAAINVGVARGDVEDFEVIVRLTDMNSDDIRGERPDDAETIIAKVDLHATASDAESSLDQVLDEIDILKDRFDDADTVRIRVDLAEKIKKAVWTAQQHRERIVHLEADSDADTSRDAADSDAETAPDDGDVDTAGEPDTADSEDTPADSVNIDAESTVEVTEESARAEAGGRADGLWTHMTNPKFLRRVIRGEYVEEEPDDEMSRTRAIAWGVGSFLTNTVGTFTGTKVFSDAFRKGTQSIFTGLERNKIMALLKENVEEAKTSDGSAEIMRAKVLERLEQSKYLPAAEKEKAKIRLEEILSKLEIAITDANAQQEKEQTEEIRKYIDLTIQTRIKSSQVLKEAVNTALMIGSVATGAVAVTAIGRAAAYSGISLMQRFGKLTRDDNLENKEAAEGNRLKEAFVSGFTETWKGITLSTEGGAGAKAIGFIGAAGTLGRAFGMGGILAEGAALDENAISSLIDAFKNDAENALGSVGGVMSNDPKLLETASEFDHGTVLEQHTDGKGEIAYRSAEDGATGDTFKVIKGDDGETSVESIANTGFSKDAGVASVEGVGLYEVSRSGEVLEDITNAATVRSGDGLSYIVDRQLRLDPAYYGFTGDVHNEAAVAAWSRETMLSFIKENGLEETRISGSAIGTKMFYLERDDSSGDLSLSMYDTGGGYASLASDAGAYLEGGSTDAIVDLESSSVASVDVSALPEAPPVPEGSVSAFHELSDLEKQKLQILREGSESVSPDDINARDRSIDAGRVPLDGVRDGFRVPGLGRARFFVNAEGDIADIDLRRVADQIPERQLNDAMEEFIYQARDAGVDYDDYAKDVGRAALSEILVLEEMKATGIPASDPAYIAVLTSFAKRVSVTNLSTNSEFTRAVIDTGSERVKDLLF